MAVIADTSPLNYLVLIEAVDILPALYNAVLIPEAVLAELTHPSAPENVRRWAASKPPWLAVSPSPLANQNLTDLDLGERDAIALAASVPGVLLLMDDARGRSEAERRGIRTVGTIGVLVAAARDGLVDLQRALDALQTTNFRISSKLIPQLIAAERIRSS